MVEPLTHAWPIPHGVTGLAIDVSRPHDKYVKTVWHYLGAHGRVTARYAARFGAHLWHQWVLPALRGYCARQGITLTITDHPTPNASRS